MLRMEGESCVKCQSEEVVLRIEEERGVEDGGRKLC